MVGFKDSVVRSCGFLRVQFGLRFESLGVRVAETSRVEFMREIDFEQENGFHALFLHVRD